MYLYYKYCTSTVRVVLTEVPVATVGVVDVTVDCTGVLYTTIIFILVGCCCCSDCKLNRILLDYKKPNQVQHTSVFSSKNGFRSTVQRFIDFVYLPLSQQRDKICEDKQTNKHTDICLQKIYVEVPVQNN